ncbi:MAG: sugar phosphorylase [Lentilitoribacter sp.]
MTDLPTIADMSSARLKNNISQLINSIYPDLDSDVLTDQVIAAFWDDVHTPRRRGRLPSNELWSEKDNYVITYGNSFTDGEHKPLDLLNHFLHKHLRDTVNGVHILPFFPYTSDDGFAVTDYRMVDSLLGSWEDIARIAADFRLMSDLVLNHMSSQGHWFNEYLQGHEPYNKFFFEASPDDDTSAVVRPRAHDLLREVETANGTKHVWCTFSHDQVDFDFSNPEVLLEFLRVTRDHINQGVRTIRLDAVAFVWKEIGTSCIHLPQTHQIVRLIRLLADFDREPVVIITETNVPNTENLSYFGNRNEAHMIYNFSLPPLLLHGLLNGTSEHLNAWQMRMPPAQMGCAYFNFTASHDGVGLRPVEGLLPQDDIDAMINTVKAHGGRVSMRQGNDGKMHPYEMNVSLFDALKGTNKGQDKFNIERFLCSQTIAMALEGVPAFYIHSMLATPNDHEGVEKSQHNRAINRHRWDYKELNEKLENPKSNQSIVLNGLKSRIAIRSRQSAFHPNATQFTLQLGNQIFGFWRQSIDRSQSIFALHNMTSEYLTIETMSLNLIGGDEWIDKLSGDVIYEDTSQIVFAPYQCRWITNRV